MDDQRYADGVGSISVIGSTVRFELLVLSPADQDANGRPRPVVLQRIVMPLEAFLHSAQKIQEAAAAISEATRRARPESGTPLHATGEVSPAPAAATTVTRMPADPDKRNKTLFP